MQTSKLIILLPTLALSIIITYSRPALSTPDNYVTYQCLDGNCRPPRYPIANMSQPEKGTPFIDPIFHSSITRITDKNGDKATGMWKGSSPLNPGILVPEYSRVNPENANGTKVIITQGEGPLFLYDTKTLQLIKGLTRQVGGPIHENFPKNLEPRWDAVDPNIFYYVYKMGFFQFNIENDTSTLIRDFSKEFPEGKWLTTDLEGEPSDNTRYWAFSIRRGSPTYDHSALITYDLKEKRIIGRLEQGTSPQWPDCTPYGKYCEMNTITVSPHGDRVVVEWNWQSATGLSTWSYNLDFTDPISLGTDGHSDIALTADGRQVHVIKDDQNDVIAMLDINTGARTNLVNLPLSGEEAEWGKGDYHISGNNYKKPGWVVVSTYGKTKKYWHYYQIFMLELKKNPRIWQIAHTHGAYPPKGRDYWAETQATINKAGSRIYWRSNWGNPNGDIDTYQTALPDTWREDLENQSHQDEVK